ncbi:hypothetical protein [Microterricola pindariensis]|uniref:MotA/TolQ/ExbB proton channel domain-containing protein n=1 Tax=Microterricola pindariensis TaxID=478010 RepID=A0ABX5AWA7_9MICO|nr:hypothetical protein [Microterricola pindariensis]PPL19218.1 hypothetical protein GY24_07100 [Microterricola pindariensis]
MSRTPASKSANLPVILLWIASLAVGAVGYLVMTSSIAAQTDLYTTGSQDVGAMLTGQSGVTLGTTLIGVGVLGLLLALAVHAHNFALAQAQAALTLDDFDDFGADDNELVHSTITPEESPAEAHVVEATEVVTADAPAPVDEPVEAPATDEKPATPAS